MKAFFLDRDGVINESHNVNRAEDLILLLGVPEAIQQLNNLKFQAFEQNSVQLLQVFAYQNNLHLDQHTLSDS
jgi:histidinol phosphatase-like enzyme